jgi:sulfate transport system substrate-binding protein
MATKDSGFAAVVIFLMIMAVSFSGCITQDSQDSQTITLYAFSISLDVLDNDLIPAFKEHWKNQTGQEVKFEASYAGSGTITNQVMVGAPVEVAILAHELDAMRLRDAGMTTTQWENMQHGGIVSNSPFIMLVREGNPKNISDWEDLTKDGVEVMHPDPSTSGGAMWSIYAIYGAGLKESEYRTGVADEAYAEDLLRRVEQNVVSMPSSARKAMTILDAGIGDVLIVYEDEGLMAIEQGRPYEIVYPRSTILSEHPVVTIDSKVSPEEEELINAFIEFLQSQEAQGIYADYGFRPIDPALLAQHQEYPPIELQFTIDYLGGWENAKANIIDDTWMSIQQEIHQGG